MYNKKVMDFFKKHNLYDEKMFNYLYDHTDFIDYNDPDMRIFIGSAIMYDKKHKKIIRFRMCIPYVTNDKMALIAIHEIVHGIVYYKHLNKKFEVDKKIEALPLLYEKLFVTENPTPELINFANYLDSKISVENNDSYSYGMLVREQLFNSYDYNFDKMSKLNDKIGRKEKNR